MLRISAEDDRDVAQFQQLHEDAKKNGFGRIFRSTFLFEDMVKSILLCNSTWEKTLVLKETKESSKEETRGNFPSAKEIASLDKELINEHCKFGYRANWIVKLAKMVESGKLNLEEMERRDMTAEQVSEKLKKLTGFGAFVTATVLMCIGYYHLLPSDIETLRIFRETLETTAQSFYDRFFPFQSLAYWFDLIQNYETKLGKLSELSQLDYKSVSGCSHIKQLKAA
ncbi:hypothetical protein Bca4012_013024 [Brassica carinata]